MITQGAARVWKSDTKSWSTAKVETRNPAAWALEILTSPCHPASRYNDSELDLESFGEFYEHCENNKYKFDWVITQNIKKDDVLNHITEATGAVFYLDIYGRKAVAIDKAQENALAVYNSQNIISISNAKSFARKTDGLRIKFINCESDLYQEDTYLVMKSVNGVTAQLGPESLIKDLTVTGVTEREHIVKYARRLLAIEELRPKTTTINVGFEGVFYTPYAKVLIQDDSLKIGLSSGVISECVYKNQKLSKIYANGTVYFESGKQYGILVNCFTGNGVQILPIKVSGNGETNELTVLTEISSSAEILPERNNVFSFGELDAAGDFTRVTTPYIISGIKRNDRGFALTLLNYNEAIYSSGPIPAYSSNITQKASPPQAEIPPDFVSKAQLDDAMSGLKNGETAIGNPEKPTDVKAVAEQGGIALSCKTGGGGLANDIAAIVYEITKTGGATVLCDSDFYAFNRAAEGFPEKADFTDWRVRAKAVNVYSKESGWSEKVTINADRYGTWIPTIKESENPYIKVAANKRTATLYCAQVPARNVYGNIVYGVLIKRADESVYHTPDNTKDATAAETNYKTDATEPVWVASNYPITLPLIGQNKTAFRLVCRNDYIYRDTTQGTAQKDYSTQFSADLSRFTDKLGEYSQAAFGTELNARAASLAAGGKTQWTVAKTYSASESPIYSQKNAVYILTKEKAPAPENTAYSFKICVKNLDTKKTQSEIREIAFLAEATAINDVTDAIITNNKLAEGAITADKIAAGTITADLIAAENILAKGARAGMVETDGLKLDNSGFWASNPLTYNYTDPASYEKKSYTAKRGEFFVGNTPDVNATADAAEFLHYVPGSGFWLKIKNFIIKSLTTLIQGIFSVKNVGDSDRNAFFTVNATNNTDSTTGTPGKTVKIDGVVSASGNISSGGTVSGAAASFSGTVSANLLQAGSVIARGAKLNSSNPMSLTYPPKLLPGQMALHDVYGGNGPTPYGNLLNIGGGGGGQLFFQWNEAQTAAGDNNWGDLWYRSWGDIQAGWTNWHKISYPWHWNWSGRAGQPTWLWGGNDGENMYVYNPSNFSVNYANYSGYTLRIRTSRPSSPQAGDIWIE